MSYSPCCGRHFHTVRSMAETSRHTVSTPPAQLRVRHSRHRPPELAGAGLKIRVLRPPARDRGLHTYHRRHVRESAPRTSRTRSLCASYHPLPPPLCFPPLHLDQHGLHRRGSRYDHLFGQLPELSRATQTHVIQWVACVPPYDLRAPFFSPHLVAHSEACAPRRCGDLQGNRSEQRGVEGRRGGVGRAGARRRSMVSYAPARCAG